jgi:hypothetical protein
LVRASKLLVADPRTKDIVFETTKLEVRVLERLHVGDDDAGWAAVSGAIQQAITQVWGGDVAVVRAEVEPRQPLTIDATMGARAVVTYESSRHTPYPS